MESRAESTAPNGIPAELWNLPVLPPPPGITSNFDNPPNHDREIIIINAVWLSLSAAAVAIRFFVRGFSKRRLGWDGYLLIIALLGSAGHSGLMISNLNIGYGKHMWDVRALSLTHSKLLQLNQLTNLYNVAICFAKLSVLSLYLTLFEVVLLTRHLIWFGMAFTIASSLAFLGVAIAQAETCLASQLTWSSFCYNVIRIAVVQAGINVFLDFYILFIPIQQVWKLNLTRKRKLGVISVFGLGFLTCIVSIARLGWSIKTLDQEDTFWAAVLTSEFSIVEINMVIIAPSLIFVPSFIKFSHDGLSTLRSRLVTSRSSSDKGTMEGSEHGRSSTTTTAKSGPSLGIEERRSIELQHVQPYDSRNYATTSHPPFDAEKRTRHGPYSMGAQHEWTESQQGLRLQDV